MAFSMKNIAVFIAFFLHITSVLARANLPCQSCGSPQLPPLPPAEPPAKAPKDGVFDVTNHGAVADGETESSSAFAAAWDAACNHPGNSTFYIPEGTFLVGPISFTGPCYNNRSPNVEIGGTLLAPTSLSAFPSSHWILFRNLQGFSLTGRTETAKLDGQGAVEAWKQPSCEKSARCDTLITSIHFINVSYATISNISLLNSKGFNLGLHHSNNINIYNLKISAPGDSPNTDGIHVSRSSNINVYSSKIGVGDDCVSIGPGSINISVSNIQCGPGHGISVGSLGHYEDEADVSGIVVKNCTLTDTDNGLRIKTYKTESASKASNIIYQNIIMNRVKNPIIIDQEYGHSKSNKPSKVSISNVYFTNVRGTTVSEIGVHLLCSSSNPCQGIHLTNVNLQYAGSDEDKPFTSNCTNAKVTYTGVQSPAACANRRPS